MNARNEDEGLLYELRLNKKSLENDAGTFEGFLSVYGIPDQQKDVVEPGAWSLARNPLPLLYRHDRNQLIGAIDELNETERGLFVKGHLNLAVERAREIYALMKEGLITGLSPGFRETKDSFVGDIRHIYKADLHEASLTPFPANMDAQISSFKEEDDVNNSSREGRDTKGMDSKEETPKEEPAKSEPKVDEVPKKEEKAEELPKEEEKPKEEIKQDEPKSEPKVEDPKEVAEDTPPKPDNSLVLNADDMREFERTSSEFIHSVKTLNELFDTRIKEYTEDGKTTPDDDKTTP